MDILKILDLIFPFADILCRLMPNVKPFLRENLIRLNDKAAIHECLVEPIPRAAWELVYNYKNPTQLISELGNRLTLNQISGGRNGMLSASPPDDVFADKLSAPKSSNHSLENILIKLSNFASEGEEAALEKKILAFTPIFSKKRIFKK